MAKGREDHEARISHRSSFGKDLARRAKSRCELCNAAGEKLEVFEVPPEQAVPGIERCVLLCHSCIEQIVDMRKFEPGEQWRFLQQAAWSEIPAVQVLAVRLLKRQPAKEDWARESLEGLFLDEEIEDWVTEAE